MIDHVRPASAEELRQAVAWAAGETVALEVLGRGSKRALGRPVEAGVLVSLERMAGIELYEPAELVMSARAGTPLAEIEARLEANQQQLAFEPADYGAMLGAEPGRASIGGVFACNLSGPRRIRAGAARDHLLGVQAVTGRGDLIKSGGRVMKNVTGYDLCKLLCGSFGTLAVMTELTFKVLPAAEETLTLVLSGLARDAAFGALRGAMGSPCDVAGAAYLPGAAASRSPALTTGPASGGVALLRLEGTGPSVRYRAAALTALLAPLGGERAELGSSLSQALWREVRDAALLPPEAPVLWRVSVPPSAGAQVVAALERAFEPAWLADWSGGLLWVALPELDDGGAAAIRSAIAGHGGHGTLVRAGAGLRTRLDVFQPQPEPLAALTARIKHSFDPQGILNPGRMVRRPAPSSA